MTTTNLPNAGIPAPIPDSFDFDAKMVLPPMLDATGHSLRIRNKQNSLIEVHNEDSIAQTSDCRMDRQRFPDIGRPLLAMYPYSDEELNDLVYSEAYCNQVGPLPAFLRRTVERNRRKKGEKSADSSRDKDRSKSRSVLPSMILSAPITRTPGQRPPVIIPDVFLHTLANKLYPPINWFTNERLQLAQHNLHELETKQFRPDGSSDTSSSDVKVTTFDVAKMVITWGSDEASTCLSPLKWQEAMANLEAALIILGSAAAVTADPQPPTFAGELRKHRLFFIGYPAFEDTYSVWYSFERTARHDILRGILFNMDYYVQSVDGRMRAREAALLYLPSSIPKRPSDSDLQNQAKVPRSVNDTARSSQSEGRTSPTCIICGAPHLIRDHPIHITTFPDARPCYSAYKEGELWTATPSPGFRENRRICVEYNLGSGCTRQHEDGRVHICSFCGKAHGALSRNTSCSQ